MHLPTGGAILARNATGRSGSPAAEPKDEPMGSFIDRIGARVVGLVRYPLLLLGLLYLTLKALVSDRDLGHRDVVRQVLLQVYFTGVQAAGPVVLMAVAVGAFAVIEGVGGVGALSGAEGLGRLITVVVLREVAPLLTGGIVIVRSVTAIAAELGTMRVHHEIEALEVMGVPPIRHLVTPRVLGGVLALFTLNVLFDLTALLGGFLIAQLFVAVPSGPFFGAVMSAISPADIAAFFVKVIVGGLGVFLIACYHGLDVERAPTEVPIAVSRAALNAFVFLVVVHAVTSLVALLYSTGLGLVGTML